MSSRLAKVALFGNVAKAVTVNLDATVGAKIGVDLLMPDGSIATTAKLAALFGSGSTSAGTLGTTDDLDEGSFHLWFTTRRAQDAAGALATNSATIDLTYTAGVSLVATLNDLADSGAGAALVKITRDSTGRISGSSSASTSDLTEGSRLYYTDARADARIAAQKGLANGLAPLGSDGKLDVSYLPAAVLGQVSYQGTWDASAGTPPTGAPSKGWYYIVTVAGGTSLSGITDWKVGDWAIYNGSAWDKVDNTDAVVTVNGQTGAVTLTAADVGAATTAQGAKADSALQPGANVSTLTNDSGFIADAPSNGQQYARKDGGWVVVASSGGTWGSITGTLADQADLKTALNAKEPSIAAGTATQFWRGDKTWQDLAAAVRAVVLTGLDLTTSAVIAATDTLLAALGKLQAQITDNLLPPGYIDGLQPFWASATSVGVRAGAAYIQGSSKVVRASADLTLTGLALTASAWSHLYVYASSGALALEASATAPASPYSGSARSKTGDTSRRYVGSVLTDASGNILKFLVSSGMVMFQTSIANAPFLVSSAGRATAVTNIACAGVVPVTAKVAVVIMATINSSADAAIGNADMSGTLSSTVYLQYVGNGVQTTHLTPLDSSQRFSYVMTATTSTGGFYARVCGYLVER